MSSTRHLEASQPSPALIGDAQKAWGAPKYTWLQHITCKGTEPAGKEDGRRLSTALLTAKGTLSSTSDPI